MKSNMLRAEMAKKGISCRQLAKIIGISSNALCEKLNGKRQFKLNECEKIISALEIEKPEFVFFF